MPTFCRHNRLVQNCPICSKEQHVDMRPVVSPGGHTVRPPRAGGPSSSRDLESPCGGDALGLCPGVGRPHRAPSLPCRPEARFRSGLVPGLRSGADAQRLAEELAFAATRLEVLEAEPPGLYAEVADASRPIEERSWLAFLIAYLGPLDDEQPFAGIEQARTAWGSDEPPGAR